MSQQLLIGIIYRSPNSSQENDKELSKLLHYIQLNYNVPKLMVGEFNYSNIKWYQNNEFGASASCENLTENELKFVSALRDFSFSRFSFIMRTVRPNDRPNHSQ